MAESGAENTTVGCERSWDPVAPQSACHAFALDNLALGGSTASTASTGGITADFVGAR